MTPFPPAKGSSKRSAPPVAPEVGPVSTGKGGLKFTLKVKAAGTTNAPGVDKTVNLF
jgi:hypothetical protein